MYLASEACPSITNKEVIITLMFVHMAVFANTASCMCTDMVVNTNTFVQNILMGSFSYWMYFLSFE